MTPQGAKQLLESPIFKAYAEGKTVKYSGPNTVGWRDIPEGMDYGEFLRQPNRYRIKPRVFYCAFNREENYIASSLYNSRQELEKKLVKFESGVTKLDIIKLVEVL